MEPKIGLTPRQAEVLHFIKVFFNEYYWAVYDKKNKHIMAKYDKQRQGLVQDVALSTDYEKSVIYEAFTHVYDNQVAI